MSAPVGARLRFGKTAQSMVRRALGKSCPYCCCVMGRNGSWNAPNAPSVDHRVPKSRGGWDTPENWLVCCRQCNEDKGSLTEEEYIAVRAGLATRLDKGPALRHRRSMLAAANKKAMM